MVVMRMARLHDEDKEDKEESQKDKQDGPSKGNTFKTPDLTVRDLIHDTRKILLVYGSYLSCQLFHFNFWSRQCADVIFQHCLRWNKMN